MSTAHPMVLNILHPALHFLALRRTVCSPAQLMSCSMPQQGLCCWSRSSVAAGESSLNVQMCLALPCLNLSVAQAASALLAFCQREV